MRFKEKSLAWQAPLIILALASFLVLGFCPLRNALVSLISNSPSGQSVPEYRKITSATECPGTIQLKALPSTEQLDPVPSSFFDIDTYGSFYPAATDGCREDVTSFQKGGHWFASIPIYLRNRVLRI